MKPARKSIFDNLRGVAPHPTRFLKKAGQKLSKIARSAIFKKVFVKLFSKSLWGLGRSPKILFLRINFRETIHLVF